MNKAFAQNEGLGEALASMFMSARWSRLYSDFDTRLGHRTLRVSDDLLDTSDSPGLAQLADAFERTFGCSFATRATNLDPDLVEVLDPIVAMMCRMIARSELQMQQLTSANITDLLEELNTRVCEMTAEFVDEFKGKKPYEIQRYLDAEDAKRREKRAKDEDRK